MEGCILENAMVVKEKPKNQSLGGSLASAISSHLHGSKGPNVKLLLTLEPAARCSYDSEAKEETAGEFPEASAAFLL